LNCPVCGFENLQGVDNCENCGADLRTVDIPQPGNDLEMRLVHEHLDVVGAAQPLVLPPDSAVSEAIRLMQDASNGCVVVVDGERLVGVFTERDAVMKVAGRSLDGVRLGDVMTPDPVVLRPDDSIAVAIHKMAVGGFRHIPLMADGRPLSVATARDLLRHVDHLLG
jgi:CBS domain-containing protein